MEYNNKITSNNENISLTHSSGRSTLIPPIAMIPQATGHVSTPKDITPTLLRSPITNSFPMQTLPTNIFGLNLWSAHNANHEFNSLP